MFYICVCPVLGQYETKVSYHMKSIQYLRRQNIRTEGTDQLPNVYRIRKKIGAKQSSYVTKYVLRGI